jgi:hypothetical protein
MQTSTKWLIGLAVVGAGIYFATKKSSGKPMSYEDISKLRAEVARMTDDQVLAMSRNIKLALAEIQTNSSKYITKYGEENFAIMIANANAGLMLADQEIAKRNLTSRIS